MKKIIPISLIFALCSCSMLPTTEPVEVVRIEKKAPMFHPPLPVELQLTDIDFTVLTPDLMNQYLTDLENGDAPQTVYYALTGKEYENLSMNMAEFKRYLRDILALVEYYQQYDQEMTEDD